MVRWFNCSLDTGRVTIAFQTNINEFVAKLRSDSSNLPKELLEREHRKVASKFLTLIVPATPVRKGKARANWQVTIDAPATDFLEEFDTGGQATITKGLQTIDSAPLFSTIWFANNVPYIDKLNQGSSVQAPSMFIEVTFMRAVQESKLGQ